MRSTRPSGLDNPGLAKTALIRELVDLSKFTEGILRTLGSAVVAVDGEGRVTFVNPAAETLLGMPAARLLQQPAASILRTRGGTPLLGEGDPVGDVSGEVDLQVAEGRHITVEVRLSHSDPEDQGGLVAILTDRTELKRAEQDARRRERLASLGELSAGVAHEIRNPLAGIGASAQLLISRLAAGDENVRLAELIVGEVGRLDRIVESMLQFASPPQPRFEQGDLGECVERSLRLVRDEAETRGLRIEFERPDDLPHAWLDPDQMEQVLLNLFRNGLQAMEEGGVLRITLRAVRRRPYVRRRAGRREEDADRLPQGQAPLMDWVEIEVADTGHGISREDQDRIFNPFYTTRSRGTGLGLAITQSIVQEHGGSISIASEPGRGTTITVDLPVDKRQGRRRNAT